MFSTNEKKKHSSWQGSFYTRKWNDNTSVIYFEKHFGGKPLLKKINDLAEKSNITFHSALVNENNADIWVSSGWEKIAKLNVLSLSVRQFSDQKEVANPENFDESKIPDLLKLDEKIFDSYWQNSEAAFKETIESCTHNYLFIHKVNDQKAGYAILGVTRNNGYLQRFGVAQEFQNSGIGSEMLQNIINFAKVKKLINIRLNTQEENLLAKNLYLKNGFSLTETNFIIFGTTKND